MRKQVLMILEKLGPFLALVFVIAIFSYLDKEQLFFTTFNFGIVAGQTAVVAIAAIGMTLIIISAGIDLSVGSVIAISMVSCTGIISWMTNTMGFHEYYSIPVGIMIAVLTGGCFGFLNGMLIILGNLPPFIVTLGMLSIVRGIALLSTGGLPVTGMPPSFRALGNNLWKIPIPFTDSLMLYIPYSFFVLLAIAVIAHCLLKYTVFGIHVYSIGSNQQTARLCGVKVNAVKVMVYTFGGLTAGLAGYIFASRQNTGQPTEAQGLELDIIAAVVVGGGSLMGGEGTILGTIIGAFIIQFLRNGCNMIGVESFAQLIIIGAIIIIAVYVDQLRRKTQ